MKITSKLCLLLIVALYVLPLFQVTDSAFAHDEDRGAKDVVVDTLVTLGSVGAIVGGGILALTGEAVENVPGIGTIAGPVMQGLGLLGIAGGTAGILTSGHNLLNDITPDEKGSCDWCNRDHDSSHYCQGP